MVAKACWHSSAVLNSMKQNPRGRPVSRSVGILMSAAFWNWGTAKSISWVAFHDRFRQKMVRDSRSAILGELGELEFLREK